MQSEKSLLEVLKIKEKMLETWQEVLPFLDDRQMAMDIACLTENFIDHSHRASLDECVTLMYAAGLAYSELLSHRLISCQPVVQKHPLVFFNSYEKDCCLQSSPVPQVLRVVPLGVPWSIARSKNVFREGNDTDFTAFTIDITSQLARRWDRNILRELYDIVGHSHTIAHNAGHQEMIDSLSGLCNSVEVESGRKVTWILASSVMHESLVKEADYVPSPRRYLSGTVTGHWRGAEVITFTDLWLGCRAMVGHKGNTRFDSGFVFAPLYFTEFVNVDHGNRRINGMGTRLLAPNGENMYGRLVHSIMNY